MIVSGAGFERSPPGCSCSDGNGLGAKAPSRFLPKFLPAISKPRRRALGNLRDVVHHLEEPRIRRQVERAHEAVLVEVDEFDAGEDRHRVELKGILPAFRRAGTDRGLS